MDRARERLLSAIEKLPVVQVAKEKAEAERCDRRRDLHQALELSSRTFELADAALIEKANPLERRLKKVRAELAELEADLEPLARSRIVAMSAFDTEVAQVRSELRSDATECADLLRSLEETNNGISGRIPGQHSFILGGGIAAPSHARIVEALSTVRDVYDDVKRVAVEAVDVTAALEPIRRRLLAAGIRLIE